VPVGRNVLAVEAGFDMKLTPAATLGLSYSGQFGSGLSDHAAKASFNMRF
jgi:outer membrane autotransporter protein